MPPTSPNDARTVKAVETEEDQILLKQHLKEVIEGTAFRGSHRSGQFLTYIVEKALEGDFDSLKERVIGVELFGRSPSYDTGDDAIVRVTASDVRKRLLQHYGKYGTSARFRISLPLGSYVPEITREPASSQQVPTYVEVPTAEPAPQPHPKPTHPPGGTQSEVLKVKSGFNRTWLIVALLITTLNLAIWGVVWKYKTQPAAVVEPLVLPWSVFFHSTHLVHLVTSDPDIAEIQQYVGGEISVSDYANHHLIPNPDTMTPQIQHFWKVILRDDKASFVDSRIVASIAELAQANGRNIHVRAARSLQMSDLQSDDNFILLGSPRSNPWSALFSNQLDFRFTFDKNSGQEIIRNVRPRFNEAAQYVPTALGGATGQSYAIIALVPNPDQNGQILLLAGANAEGTEAAGRLVTDIPRLSTALKNCDISPTGPLQHFELLLKLNTMAGSSDNTYVEACHILSNSSVHQ